MLQNWPRHNPILSALLPLALSGCAFGLHRPRTLLQFPPRLRQLRAELFDVVLVFVARLAGGGEFLRVAAQFELGDNVPGEDAQGLLLVGTQLARDFVNDTKSSQ